MAVNFTPHFLSSSSVLVTGSFAMKRHGFSLKPTTKLLVNSCQTDYFKKQRFDDSSSSSLPSYSLQSEFLPDIVELQVKDVLYEPVQKKQDAMFFSASISTHPVLTMVALLHSADNAYTISGLIRGTYTTLFIPNAVALIDSEIINAVASFQDFFPYLWMI
ncbi:hypothetical protein ISN45_Aa04g009930 [Arabidopsis thaliana x Arabidopsis arenosa]|uniref:Uncharacterized protein n=1 Tax=Arabidopsis thaliana x Arabidopsis arenosa TaxID=1240361 RepID=A0A8T2A4S4_9BRAS|nr:hypothetical protein ISN45_Aa04g009930 [Arabidopsis thaliana x Arabidopsis arenosa]